MKEKIKNDLKTPVTRQRLFTCYIIKIRKENMKQERIQAIAYVASLESCLVFYQSMCCSSGCRQWQTLVIDLFPGPTFQCKELCAQRATSLTSSSQRSLFSQTDLLPHRLVFRDLGMVSSCTFKITSLTYS